MQQTILNIEPLNQPLKSNSCFQLRLSDHEVVLSYEQQVEWTVNIIFILISTLSTNTWRCNTTTNKNVEKLIFKLWNKSVDECSSYGCIIVVYVSKKFIEQEHGLAYSGSIFIKELLLLTKFKQYIV